MLSLEYILKVGDMLYKNGEGPMQTEGPPPTPVLANARIQDEGKVIRFRIVERLCKDGDIGIAIEHLNADGNIAPEKAS